MPEKLTYKLSVTVYHHLHDTTPRYLSELNELVANVASQRHLRPVCQNDLMVPLHKLSSAHGLVCFSVTALSVGLEFQGRLYLHDPALGLNSFRRQLKTFLFVHY